MYALKKYRKLSIQKAARGAVDVHADKLRDDCGIIALDPAGNVALESNTNVCRRAFRVEEQAPFMGIWMDK